MQERLFLLLQNGNTVDLHRFESSPQQSLGALHRVPADGRNQHT